MQIMLGNKRFFETLDLNQLIIIPTWILLALQVSPQTFNQIAIFLNINMWIHFYYKIDRMAYSLQLKSISDEESKRIKQILF